MSDDLKIIKKKYGENMINYYESSDHYEINELYNKNKLKVKTVILTDG